MSNGLVYGFYNQNNLGDDIFGLVLPSLFPDVSLSFVNPGNHSPKLCHPDKPLSLILFGGGDLFNEWFLHDFDRLLREQFPDYKGKVVAIGTGISFASSVEQHPEWFRSFDHVFLRSKEDAEKLGETSSNISYLPDLAFFMPSSLSISLSPHIQATVPLPSITRVGVFLMRTISSSGYSRFIKSMVSAMNLLQRAMGCIFHLYAFNTKETETSDIEINDDVVRSCGGPSWIVNHRERLSVSQMETEMKQLDVAICMKFHAHVLCIRNKIPFLSLGSLRKVKALLRDTHLSEFAYDLQREYGWDIDEKRLVRQFASVMDSRETIRYRQATFLSQVPSIEVARQWISSRLVSNSLVSVSWPNKYLASFDIPTLVWDICFDHIVGERKESKMTDKEELYRLARLVAEGEMKLVDLPAMGIVIDAEKLCDIILLLTRGSSSHRFIFRQGLLDKIMRSDFSLTADVEWLSQQKESTSETNG